MSNQRQWELLKDFDRSYPVRAVLERELAGPEGRRNDQHELQESDVPGSPFITLKPVKLVFPPSPGQPPQATLTLSPSSGNSVVPPHHLPWNQTEQVQANSSRRESPVLGFFLCPLLTPRPGATPTSGLGDFIREI
ncbi:hypothetical protein Cadr_000013533 [Camelus dromedarius]|uniref:Uncharacterized protein n=1 Tax=Camelus dromedarius TaxID=9838 RepID=A0A5N4DBX9_CAMDR|nr:hypothetical protein Cadr_000013533 [Camelus dromedarius]